MAGPNLLAALVEICGPSYARAARPVDVVGGRRAGFVAVPATSAAVADVVRLAADRGLTVVPRGSGSKINWGTPGAPADLILDTGRLDGIIAHDPETRTAEVRAGTPVQALQAAVALHGQGLPVDPPSRTATVGGMLAVNESGPLRYHFGPPAEHVEQVATVGTTGAITSVGPAGVGPAGVGPAGVGPAGVGPADVGPADPSALVGAAGVITSAVLRLRPLPGARRWVTVPVSNPAGLGRLTGPAADHAPSALEVDLPGGTGTLAALIEGDEADVVGRAGALTVAWGAGAEVTTTAPPWWGRYPFGPEDVAVRLSVSPADLPATIYALADALAGPVPVRGSAGLGSVHAVLPGALPAERLAQIVDILGRVLMARNGRAVPVAAPFELATRIDMASRRDFF